MPPNEISANERQVLAVLRDRAVVSRADLAALTGLPKTTVAGVIGRLRRRALVVEYPPGDHGSRCGPGRPAAGVALAAPAGRVGVIALSHVKIRIGVAGFDGRVVARREAGLQPEHGEQHALEHGLRLLAEAVAGAGGSGLAHAVLGIPAPFQREVGVVAGPVPDELRDAVPELPAALRWFRADPAPAIAAALGVPVSADNDANLGALGEATFGAARGMDNVVYVKVAEGLGAGLVLNGQLYRGARGLAGELAHVQVLDDGPWCMCGGRGCLAHAFGGFLAPFVESAYRKPLGFTDLLSFAAIGEAGTRRIVTDAGRRVGRVLADTCMMLSPEAIVVDGLLGAAGPPFIAGVREMIGRHASTAVAETVQVLAGTLGAQAELLGAVALARREHADRPGRPAGGR